MEEFLESVLRLAGHVLERPAESRIKRRSIPMIKGKYMQLIAKLCVQTTSFAAFENLTVPRLLDKIFSSCG